ncbi:hypothetical protein RJ641_004822 [Dillenia turbinata]|uniref:Uncharacterized protein n=1 Tax=Dillenia turbinata TaxID=194707 RepID=A0AAN8V9B5_9MAGN
MVKKRVPEWLNSSLWSSSTSSSCPPPPPSNTDEDGGDDDRLPRRSSKIAPSTHSYATPPSYGTSNVVSESRTKPPIPVSPPAIVREEHPKREVKDLRRDDDNGTSPNLSSAIEEGYKYRGIEEACFSGDS